MQGDSLMLHPLAPHDPRVAALDLPGYLDTVAVHCPFLAPARAAETLVWRCYLAAPPVDDRIVPALSGLVLEAAERVRAARTSAGRLVCENVAVLGDASPTRWADLLAWPHWIAKALFASTGLM